MNNNSNNELLRITLIAAVPQMIRNIELRGGINEWDMRRVKGYGDILGSEGDTILYQGKKGQTARNMNILCDALAVMAFFPGGVTFTGMHFEGKAASV